MIRETVLDTATPIPGALRLSVDGDTATLTWSAAEPDDPPPPTGAAGATTAGATTGATVEVPARSLLLALRAAWDDRHAGAADLDPAPARRPRRGPMNGRVPWTAELDMELKGAWLSASDTTPAFDLIGELATRMGRSRNSIRARLARVGCDPDVAGRVLRQEAAEP